MRKKLLRHEIKETRKIMIGLMGIMIAEAVLACFWNMIPGTESLMDRSALMIIVFLCMLMEILLAPINMLRRYYKTISSDNSYYKMMIPCKNTDHLNVNIKAGLFWTILLGITGAFCLYFIDLSMGNEKIFEIANLVNGSLFIYEYNVFEKILCEIIFVVNPFLCAVCIYIIGVTVILLTQFFVSKTNSESRNCMLAIVTIVVFNISEIVVWLIVDISYDIIDRMQENYFNSPSWSAIGNEIEFLTQNLTFIILDIAYLIVAVVLCILCKHLAEKKVRLG